MLTKPLVKDKLETLKYIQTSEIGSYHHFETTLDPLKAPIIPIGLYLDIERKRDENTLQSNDTNET